MADPRIPTADRDGAELLEPANDGERRRNRPVRWAWHGLILVLVALAAWYYIDFGELKSSLLTASPRILVVLLLLASLDRVLMGWKWHQLMRAVGIEVPFRTVVAAYYKAGFAGHVAPTSLGGDMLRAYAVARRAGEWARVLGSMVVEKAIGIIAAIALATAGVLLLGTALRREGLSFLVFAVPAAAVASCLLFYFSLSEKFGAHLERWAPGKLKRLLGKLHESYALFRTRKGMMLANLLIAIGEQTLQIVLLYCCAMAIGVEASPWLLLAVLALSQFLRKIAIILEGWVLGEFVLVLTCTLAGIDQTHALAFSLLAHAANVVASIPGGILLVTSPR